MPASLGTPRGRQGAAAAALGARVDRGHPKSAQRAPPQGGDRRQVLVIAIDVQDRDVVTQGRGRDQAIDRRAHRSSGSTRSAVELDSLLEYLGSERRVDEGKGEHGLARQPEGALVPEALEDLLDHGQAGDNLLEIDESGEIHGSSLPEDPDPDRGVDEVQGSRPFLATASGPVLAHPREVPFPQTGPAELHDPSRPGAAHELLERTVDRGGPGFLAAQARGFVQQICIKHNVSALHTHIV